VLAFIEHGFLVVPWQDTSLFRWAMRNSPDARNRERVALADFNHIGATPPADSTARNVSNPLAGLESARQ
jgi:hypothetical protein